MKRNRWEKSVEWQKNQSTWIISSLSVFSQLKWMKKSFSLFFESAPMLPAFHLQFDVNNIVGWFLFVEFSLNRPHFSRFHLVILKQWTENYQMLIVYVSCICLCLCVCVLIAVVSRKMKISFSLISLPFYYRLSSPITILASECYYPIVNCQWKLLSKMKTCCVRPSYNNDDLSFQFSYSI